MFRASIGRGFLDAVSYQWSICRVVSAEFRGQVLDPITSGVTTHDTSCRSRPQLTVCYIGDAAGTVRSGC